MKIPMSSHFVGITTATAGILLCTLLPFLPGPYDSLAVPLSMMSQTFGIVGLLLVPFGAIWLASRHWSRLGGKQYVFAIAALIASSVVWIIISLAALLSSGMALGLGLLALWVYVVSRVFPRLSLLKSTPGRPTSAVPLYLLIVPVAVTLVQTVVVAPSVEFSRSRAIRNSARLIADIEQYRAAHGRYPESLLSVW